jgi:acyl-CoA hydrolase
MSVPARFTNADALAADIIRTVGRNIVLELPLGLGKANPIANALYARAAQDRAIKLTIFTALTLEKPRYGSELERRFLEPVIERLFGAWPELAYARALRDGTLPPNIEVNQFFFAAGRWLNVTLAQRTYISANYTHAAADVIARGVNVVAQLVAKREPRYSLSCNTDLTLDLLKARAEGRARFFLAAQVNDELPFMPGPGDLPAEIFDAVLDGPQFPLFAPPKEPIDLAEHAIGLHVARLVPDGGTLQIGIGQEGDAALHALILRHSRNDVFREAIETLAPGSEGEFEPFAAGLYGVSEMFVDGYLELLKAGILKREVDGALLHAAFFLGPKSFYRALREMDSATLAKLQMTSVSFTNELYGGEAAKRAARVKARFVNNAMMATLLGAVVSDGLEDGRVVSGVGGQYNFVAQAFALEGARSVLTLKSVRETRGRASSNILFSYGHETIPRHLRDIVVTEYGIADLRGRSDEEVVQAMLSVADSRFQSDLLRRAKDARKVAGGFEIPATQRDNTPERLEAALGRFRAEGVFPGFPFGSDFDEVEQRLLPVLERLRSESRSWTRLLSLMARGVLSSAPVTDLPLFARLGLLDPRTLRDRWFRAMVNGARQPPSVAVR